MTLKKIRRRVSVVVLDQDRILGFYARDPHNQKEYFFIPGGMIEEGESAEQAAVRETLEETGYSIEIIPFLRAERRYDFEWDGQINDCITIFLAGRLLNKHPVTVNDASYHRGVGWESILEIDKIFSYHPDILEPTQGLVRQLLK